jgi:hypothetical protein
MIDEKGVLWWVDPIDQVKTITRCADNIMGYTHRHTLALPPGAPEQHGPRTSISLCDMLFQDSTTRNALPKSMAELDPERDLSALQGVPIQTFELTSRTILHEVGRLDIFLHRTLDG